MPVIYSGVQYSGVWTLQQQMQAIAAGTWPEPFTQLYAWGKNSSGALGLGNTTNYSSPKQVGGGDNWKILSGGYYTYVSLGIKLNGTLWAWGDNGSGQLGLGNLTTYSSPKQVGALTNWSSVSVGNSSTIAIKTNGTLWSWGQGNGGQLGLNNSNSYSSPKQIGSLTTWATVSQSAANYGHVLATKTDGTLWAWGGNLLGQLGVNNVTYYSSPKQIGALTTWLKVSAGNYFSLAVKTDGTLWSWGRNNSGQLGIGNTTNYSSPVQVGALTNWSLSAGSAGFAFCSVVKTDGTLWNWGQGNVGELGFGNYTLVNDSPKQLGSATNWSQSVAKYGNSLFLNLSGQLFACGYSNAGALGLGGTSITNSPIQVGASSSWIAIFPSPNQAAFAIQR